MKTPITIALASAAITAATVLAWPAPAQPPATAGSVNVSLVRIADLDLSSEAGLRTLDRRLARAAREVCGETSDADLVGRNAARECRTQVMVEVRARVHQQADRDDHRPVLAAR